jgi:hypothetical protein
MYYAGIGSRETPSDILHKMSEIAKFLEEKGYTLRSGGADGADQAFSDVVTNAEIWIPWASFYTNEKHVVKVISESDRSAFASVDQFHPSGKYLKPAVRKLMARNFRQVIGEEDSSFIICWTKDGKDSGGTGQAIRIARYYKIPVINLKTDNFDEYFLSRSRPDNSRPITP